MKFNTEDISDFPEYLVSKAKQLIEESDDISFTPRQKMGEHIFGDIKIRKFNGEYIELVSELVKTGNVKKVDDFIPKGKKRTILNDNCFSFGICWFFLFLIFVVFRLQSSN